MIYEAVMNEKVGTLPLPPTPPRRPVPTASPPTAACLASLHRLLLPPLAAFRALLLSHTQRP